MATRLNSFQFTIRESMFAVFALCMALGWFASERWNQSRYDEMYERNVYAQVKVRSCIEKLKEFSDHKSALREFDGKLVRLKAVENGWVEAIEENP